MLQELYESRFDLAMWSKKDSETKWSTIQKNLWKLHMPYPLHHEDTLPCSATQIFGPNSHAGLEYHRVWRRFLLEDVLCSLREVGWLSSDKTESKEVSEVFKRFRDTFLTYGSSIPPAELFRRFRGRDLDPQLLLKQVQRSMESTELPETSEDLTPILARS
nr:SJCHGC04518 protein [Schistosoma japonicum]